MNHLGEIERMSHMARPDIAIITNAAPAHLEGVGSLKKVAQAKSEIFAGMPDTGVAVLNADDSFFAYWRERAQPRRCVSFGLTAQSDVWADVERAFPAAQFTLHAQGEHIAITLPLPGVHNVYNALAAAAAARALEMDLDRIRAGLERVAPVPGRLVARRAACGARVFDDTYNANPASLRMALETLCAAPAPRILVLGDMGELGAHAQRLHKDVGSEARAMGVSRLFAIGPLTRYAVEAFGESAQHFEDPAALIDVLKQALDPGATVLIKGSRFMHMEDIVAAIVADGAPAGSGAT
jgi:UDP-N-acetylmuramoyl-tripeptide--D-alanyl-D-alanine ligase